MKTKQFISASSIMSLALIVFVIFSSSCAGDQQGKKEKQTEDLPVQKVEKPNMDIHAAVFMGDMKAIQQHMDIGTDLNSRDAYGSTPLNIATTFGKTDVALLLTKAGADINATNLDGSTPLHTAAFFCRTEIVEALLKQGADKSLRNQYGSTALESVSAKFEDVKAIYIQIGKDLGPLGLRMDLERIESTRPLIANMIAE